MGVAKYLTWPQTTWTSRITCTHHLWTIPLLLTACGGVMVPPSLFLSLVLTVTAICLSRILTPSEIRVGKKQCKYMNINLAHEMWTDIKIPFFQINCENWALYLFRAIWRWQAFNTLMFGLLTALCKIWFAGDNHVCKPAIID